MTTYSKITPIIVHLNFLIAICLALDFNNDTSMSWTFQNDTVESNHAHVTLMGAKIGDKIKGKNIKLSNRRNYNSHRNKGYNNEYYVDEFNGDAMKEDYHNYRYKQNNRGRQYHKTRKTFPAEQNKDDFSFQHNYNDYSNKEDYDNDDIKKDDYADINPKKFYNHYPDGRMNDGYQENFDTTESFWTDYAQGSNQRKCPRRGRNKIMRHKYHDLRRRTHHYWSHL